MMRRVWKGTILSIKPLWWENLMSHLISSMKIPVSQWLQMLGITIDNKLKFDNHVATSKICRKVSQQIAVLKRMKKMLPFETRRDLYLAFILPHFNYCSETSNCCTKSAADKLEWLNERTIRFVFRDKSHELLGTSQRIRPLIFKTTKINQNYTVYF